MKRFISVALAVVVFAALAIVGVSAAEFVPSADVHEISLISATINGQDATAYIEVTLYSERHTLDDEEEAALVAARDELVNGVQNVSGNYKVGALFDVSYVGTEPLPEEFTAVITLAADFGDAELAAIYQDLETGEWDNADCVYADGVATITMTHFCPVAFLVKEGSVIITDPSEDSPQTGDSPVSALVAVGAVLAAIAVAGTVVASKRKDA